MAQRQIIAVGSTRRPKLAAVTAALRAMEGLLPGEFEVVGCETASGVGHTPRSREELMQGARQRAEALRELAARSGETWAYCIGLEGGLDSIAENGTRRVFLESWAYVLRDGEGHFGRSGSIELPAALVCEVFDRGIELGVAIDEFAGRTGIRDTEGAWGVFSRGLVSREDSFRTAVIAAFAPFYNKRVYDAAAVAG
jgi:inosine/xanthosine triphosphatase